MKYSILIFILVTITSLTDKDKCENPKSGTYHSVFDKKFRDNYGLKELVIDDKTAVIRSNQLTNTYKIEKVSECRFRFLDTSHIDTSKMTALQRQLASLGTPYYEIDYINNDTLYFVYRHNPHIMINSGKFIFNNNK